MMEMHNAVGKSELLKELYAELNYHQQDGVTYRSQTTELALILASLRHNTSLFHDREKTYLFACQELVDLDEDRLRDVAKMLSVVTRDLHRKKTLPDDVKAQLEERRKKRKPLSLVQ